MTESSEGVFIPVCPFCGGEFEVIKTIHDTWVASHKKLGPCPISLFSQEFVTRFALIAALTSRFDASEKSNFGDHKKFLYFISELVFLFGRQLYLQAQLSEMETENRIRRMRDDSLAYTGCDFHQIAEELMSINSEISRIKTDISYTP